MKSPDLHKVWSAPGNSRLTAKQQSFRLPTHVAAKINALCDVFPNKTKTEIVGDLLAAALDELVPVERGKRSTTTRKSDDLFGVGCRGRVQRTGEQAFQRPGT